MKQYEPCIQNNNNNNNFFKKRIKTKIKKGKEWSGERGRACTKRDFYFLFYSSLRFFLRCTKIGP